MVPAMPDPVSLSAPEVVIDTNRVLDLWLFDDPCVQALKRCIVTGVRRWVAVPAMRAELAAVLAYPVIEEQLARRAMTADGVLDAFDRWACPVPAAPPATVFCKDSDDQMFIDLAVDRCALLFSRDRQVVALRRKLAALGVTVHAGAGCSNDCRPA